MMRITCVVPWSRRLSTAALIVAGLLLASPLWAKPSLSTIQRSSKMGIALPIVRQANSYSCGAAALMSVLQRYRKFDGRETSLYQSLGTTPADGTRPDRIVKVARRFGLDAELKEGLSLKDLRQAVREDKAVIVDLQAWRPASRKSTPWSRLWADGHYVVLKSVGKKYVYFMDPSAGPDYAYIPVSELRDRWHDFETYRTSNGTQKKVYHRNLGIIIDGPGARRGPGLIRME
jgi:uncharacterized protein